MAVESAPGCPHALSVAVRSDGCCGDMPCQCDRQRAQHSVPERGRRILAVANFLTEVTQWGWPEAPTRRLMFASGNPPLPQPLPRFLPRTQTGAFKASPHRLAADALLLQRAGGRAVRGTARP